MKEIFQEIFKKVKGKFNMSPVSAKEIELAPEEKTKMPEYKTTVNWHKKEEISIASDDTEVFAFKQNIQDSNRHQEISETAYYLWEQAGRPDGKDSDFWTEAEKIVTQKNLDSCNSQSGDGPILTRQSVLFP